MIIKLKNEYEIDAISQQFQSKRTTLDRPPQPPHLWILSDDKVLDIAANRLEKYDQTLVLRRSAEKWNSLKSQNSKQDATIEYALEQLEVSDLVLCGHSFTVASDNHQFSSLKNDSQALAGNRLLDRVRSREQINVTRRQQVLELVHLVSQNPLVQQMIAAGQLKLHAFFYMTESGLYQKYDPAIRKFVTSQAC